MKVGFIGLGQMGARMANNLIKPEHKLMVFDVMEANCADAVSAGATLASGPAQMAEECDVVVTMLRAADQVRGVYAGPGGLFEGARASGKPKLLIDSSTVDTQTPKDLFAEKPSHVCMVDAPVSGGIGAAAAGSLTFMCGGPTASFQSAEPILKHMGKSVFHCGETPGSGQIAKICNNLVLAICMTGVSEGMNLGVRLGMDPKTLADIMNVSSGRCWSSDTYNPCPGVNPNVPGSNEYNGGFVVDLMRKDLGLALDAARSTESQTPLGSSVSQMYDMLSKRGKGQKDFGIMYQFIKGAEGDESFTA